MKLTVEMINAAKNAKTAEELLALAKENNVEANEEEIKTYFEQIHTTGELADEELDNVAGGWCYKDGRPVITIGEFHDCFICAYCGWDIDAFGDSNSPLTIHKCRAKDKAEVYNSCKCCKYIIYRDGLWLCDSPENRK